MKKKDKDNIINTLMGFYHTVCGLYEGLSKIKDLESQGLLLKEHLYQLILFHKDITETYNIPVPQIDDMYKMYCSEYLKKMKGMEQHISGLLLNLKKGDEIGYII